MSELDLARWQFGITTVYHFIFVPLTLGLSLLVAGMQTASEGRRTPTTCAWTKFFGTLFLMNFAGGGRHRYRPGIQSDELVGQWAGQPSTPPLGACRTGSHPAPGRCAGPSGRCDVHG